MSSASKPVVASSRKYATRGLAFCFAVFLVQVASAQHVSLPPVNLGGTSFLDGVAGPGLFLQDSNEYYHGDRFTGPAGERLRGDNSVRSAVAFAHLAHLSNFKILGGYYGAEVLLPIVHLDVDTDLGSRGNRTGLGDLSISPFMLQWSDHKLLGMPYFHRLNLGLTLPTASYSRDSPVNLGSNVVSLKPYYAFTWFLTPRLETSWRFHYLWSSENRDPRPAFHADRVQSGQAVHFNGAVSYELRPGVRAGLAGYYLKQITEQKIDGQEASNSKERVAAIGPGMAVTWNGLSVKFNVFFEFGARNRPEGTKLALRVSKVM